MDRRFVLVKSYYGLGGDLCVLLGAWRLARQTARELVVDWSGGRYGSVDDGDLFGRLFAEPRFPSPSDVPELRDSTVFPPEWIGRALLPPVTYLKEVDLTASRPDDVPPECTEACIVITRDSRHIANQVAEYGQLASALKLRADIQAAVDKQLGRLQAHEHSIGIHFRHGNGEKKVMAPDPRWFRNRINGKLAQLGLEPKDLGLYVATDCKATLDYFKRFYPNVIDLPKSFRPNGSGALHVGRTDLSSDEKIQMAADALIDIFTLARCQTFVGSRGYFTLLARLLRNDRDTFLYPGVRVVSPDELLTRFASATGDPVFGPPIRRMRIPADGLLVERSGEARTLRYYEDTIMSLAPTQSTLSPEEQMSMRRLIAARRTY